MKTGRCHHPSFGYSQFVNLCVSRPASCRKEVGLACQVSLDQTGDYNYINQQRSLRIRCSSVYELTHITSFRNTVIGDLRLFREQRLNLQEPALSESCILCVGKQIIPL